MKSIKSTSYFLRSRKDDTILCHIEFQFSETCSQFSHFGSVKITIRYSEPEFKNAGLKRHTINQSWWKEGEGDFRMGITRFSIPVCLRSHSIAQFIWSEIYQELSKEVRGNLLVFGSLNSGDAFSPLTDSERIPVSDRSGSPGKPLLMNQVERRNRLWMSILSDEGNTRPTFTCDNEGNGSFSGYLKDPLIQKPLIKLLVESCNSGSKITTATSA